MLALFLSSFLVLGFCTIFGLFTTKFISGTRNITEIFFIGLVVSNNLTTSFSLFFPLNFPILLLFISGCAILTIFLKKELKILWFLFSKKKYVIFCSLPIILVAFLISLNPPINQDTGLYHLQNIKWIINYPVVPGLANLHGRFGFNPNIFTFFALTSLDDVFKQEIFSVNFIVFSIIVLYFVNKLNEIYKKQGISNFLLFYAIIFFLIVYDIGELSSPSPDFLLLTIPLFIFCRIIDLSENKKNAEFNSYVPVLFLTVYIITVKLSALPLGLLFVFIIIKFHFKVQYPLWRMLVFIGIIIVPWLVRNIILSGWLVYPFPSLDLFNFDWRVPLYNVVAEKHAITGWARSPGENHLAAANMDLTGWLPIWWERRLFLVKIFVLISVIFPFIALAGYSIRKAKINFDIVTIIIISFSGVIFWFMLAPNFRFGKAFIYITSLSPLLYLKFKLQTSKLKHSRMIYFLVFLFLFGFVALRKIDLNYKLIVHETLSRLIRPQIIDVPQNYQYKKVGMGNIIIYVPIINDLCYNHCLPCTPYFDHSIVLRGNTIADGFKYQKNK